jgi:hypothetical protein
MPSGIGMRIQRSYLQGKRLGIELTVAILVETSKFDKKNEPRPKFRKLL